MKGKYAEEKDLFHRGIKPRIGTSHDDRRWMLRPPPANRPEDNRHVDKCKNAKESAQKRSSVRLLNQRAQQQVGNVEKPEHKRGREPGIPSPVNSPRRL